MRDLESGGVERWGEGDEAMKGDLVGRKETRGQQVKRKGQSEWVF